jgi:glycosyltransferase involved in cell wall biosynthesis
VNEKTISIVGTVGVPAAYGGFETLAENLVRYCHDHDLPARLVVYCSRHAYPVRPLEWLGAELKYVPLPANGIYSIPYDVISLFAAAWHRSDVILLLGVSGAVALPLLWAFSGARLVTNVDGMEWKREKWGRFARWYLRLSERIAVRFSHVVVADNDSVARYLAATYGCAAEMIPYGGDHALLSAPAPSPDIALPSRYALALCRIEPENNVSVVLEAFRGKPNIPLVFVGNWQHSQFGRRLRSHYAGVSHLYLLDPIYDPGLLRSVRTRADLYVHGHSAGGTNPALVEMMHFGLPILAYDCVFNRNTTENKAIFFKDAVGLRRLMDALTDATQKQVGANLRRVARERYVWERIGEAYFRAMGAGASHLHSTPQTRNR